MPDEITARAAGERDFKRGRLPVAPPPTVPDSQKIAYRLGYKDAQREAEFHKLIEEPLSPRRPVVPARIYIALIVAALGLLAGCATTPTVEARPTRSQAVPRHAADANRGLVGRWSGDVTCAAGAFRGELDFAVRGAELEGHLRLFKPSLPLLSRTVTFTAKVDSATGTLALASPTPELRSVRAVFDAERDELTGYAVVSDGEGRFLFVHKKSRPPTAA